VTRIVNAYNKYEAEIERGKKYMEEENNKTDN